jgi:hypothetical protein
MAPICGQSGEEDTVAYVKGFVEVRGNVRRKFLANDLLLSFIVVLSHVRHARVAGWYSFAISLWLALRLVATNSEPFFSFACRAGAIARSAACRRACGL